MGIRISKALYAHDNASYRSPSITTISGDSFVNALEHSLNAIEAELHIATFELSSILISIS